MFELTHPAVTLLAGCHHSSLGPLATVCTTLLTHPAFEAHQAAVRASPALQSKLATLLPDLAMFAGFHLEVVFGTGQADAESSASAGSSAGGAAGAAGSPALDGTAGAAHNVAAWQLRVATSCLQLTTAPCIQGGVQFLALSASAERSPARQQQQVLKYWLAHLTRVLQAVPAERPPGMPAAEFVHMLLQAASAAARPLSLVDSAGDGLDAAESHSPRQHTASWGLAHFVSGMAAARMLPHLARVLTLLLRDGELAVQLAAQPAAVVAATCNQVAAVARHAGTGLSMGEALDQEMPAEHSISTLNRVGLVSAALAASTAIYQLLHFAAELPLLSARSGEPAGLAPAGAQLASSCLNQGCLCMATAFQQSRKLAALPAEELRTALQQQQVPARLRQTHITACRLLHYMVAASEGQLSAVPILSNWPLIASCCTMPFRAAADLALGAAGSALDPR